MDDVCSTSQPREVQEAKPTVKQAVACSMDSFWQSSCCYLVFYCLGFTVVLGHFSFKFIKSIVMIHIN
jgi:hypothetical protein